ncbi:hypothetical protein QUF64_04960 [Anaerolineales bacterium HSG6]|nr:hypothetical protein [Anaerolineales bacterium HSG6]
MVTQHQLSQWLHEGITAAKAGQPLEARSRLLDVVEHDQTNEVAWFWLYRLFERYEDRRVCLENLITINPQNQWAKQELVSLSSYLALSPPAPIPMPSTPVNHQPNHTAQPITTASTSQVPTSQLQPQIDEVALTAVRLITAFWAGISFMLLSGGIIAGSEWLASIIRSRYYLSLGQLIELNTTLILLGLGFMSFIISLSLLFRLRGGYYGSLALAVTIMLMGPILSFLASPPIYLGAVCTGGMAGVVLLLTLASSLEFE